MRRALPAVVLGCLLAVVTLAVVLLGSAGGPRTPEVVDPVDGVLPDRPGVVVPLPSSGWRPGDDALAALMTGGHPRAGRRVRGGRAGRADAAVGGALLWPAGWSARRAADGRAEILDPGGGVVLREGDGFFVGGGGCRVRRTTGPAAGGPPTLADMSIPQKVPAPAPDPTAGPGTPVRVPTSTWTPGQPAMTDLFTGRELAAEGSCVFGRPTDPAHAPS